MPLRPFHARILVQRVEECDQQVGGVIIPAIAKEEPQRGKVIAAGNGDVRPQNRQSVYRDPTAVSEVSRPS
jgi:chaperonin GroES